jgi:hypothetical protein
MHLGMFLRIIKTAHPVPSLVKFADVGPTFVLAGVT